MRKKEKARSTTPKGRSDMILCWSWVRGECAKGDSCRFFHDPKAKPKSKAAPADGPKSKPKPKPKASPTFGCCVSAEDSDDDMANPEHCSNAKDMCQNVRSRKSVSFDDVNEEIYLVDVHPDSSAVWKEIAKKPLRPDLMYYKDSDHELRNQRRKEQSEFDALRAQAKAILMKRFSEAREVIIPVNAKGDIAMTMSLDDEEGLFSITKSFVMCVADMGDMATSWPFLHLLTNQECSSSWTRDVAMI